MTHELIEPPGAAVGDLTGRDRPVAEDPARSVRSHRAPVLGVAAVVAVFVAPEVLGEAIVPAMVTAGILGVAAVGLGLLSGRAGQVSLGQAGVVAIGGYAAGYASARWSWPAEVALLLAVVAGVVTAALTSPILRLRGLYFATATLALAIIVERLLVALISITGGSSGLLGIRPLTVAGVPIDEERDFYYLAWGVAFAVAGPAALVVRGRFGRALDAIRFDEEAAAAAGIAVARHKAAVWIVSGAFAGLAGGLYAYYNLFLTPDQFTLGFSIDLIAAVIVGGATTVIGPLVGIVAIEVVPVHLEVGERYAALVSPVLLVLFAGLAPAGIVPTVGMFGRRARNVVRHRHR